MPAKIAVDSGPLVALFDKDDRYHSAALRFVKNLKAELASNLAVVREVFYLLDFNLQVQKDFLKWLSDGALTLCEVTSDDFSRIDELFEKYANLKIDFTDATLIALCERLGIREIATVDKDFSIYRLKGKKTFENVFF